jgi:hypothetical protein
MRGPAMDKRCLAQWRSPPGRDILVRIVLIIEVFSLHLEK